MILGGVYHGYSKTDDKHIRDIFSHLDFDKCHSLLDVGCGKGVVMREATKYPFEYIAGIDIDPKMIYIAKNNFDILKKKIKVETCDALKYEKYGEYDTLFFSNPVSVELTEKIVDRVLLQKKEEIVTICFYHMTPQYRSVFMDTGRCTLVDKLFDPVKQYETYIMEVR